MQFFNRAKNEYEDGFIKNKDFILSEQGKNIKSINSSEMIDLFNPYYYLTLRTPDLRFIFKALNYGGYF